MKPYAELTAKGQAQRIRRALDGVIDSEWGIHPSDLTLVSQDYNTTFRVDSGPNRFALRVNVTSTHPKERIQTEIAFVRHLVGAKTFKVAAPIPKRDGEFIASIEVPGFKQPVFAVLYEWLPDPTISENATPESMFGIGRATRELHELGATFARKDHSFSTLTEPYYGDEYRLPGKDLDLALFEECATRTIEVFAKLEAQPKIPLHADLHQYNLKFAEGQLSIFDFDDAMVSWPIMDAAISMWYFRRSAKGREFESDYWRGFDASPSDFGLTGEEFETLVAARTLLLVNYTVGAQNAAAQQDTSRFVRRCEALLRHYLATGRFAPGEVN